jgi:phosphoglycerate dehydrogenase-like enzyme
VTAAPGATPIVLFIDDGFELEPFAEAFAGELDCRAEVTPGERAQVVAGGLTVGNDPLCDPPAGVRALGLDELLATSDAISLHLPGRPGGPPLLDARRLATVKPGAILVNLSRASLVDLDAVVAALGTGALAGAASDVWPHEPPGGDHRLQTPGLLVTPHVGWSSPQAQDAYRAEAIATLRAALAGAQEPAGDVR